MLDPIWGFITKFVGAILSKRKADKIPLPRICDKRA